MRHARVLAQAPGPGGWQNNPSVEAAKQVFDAGVAQANVFQGSILRASTPTDLRLKRQEFLRDGTLAARISVPISPSIKIWVYGYVYTVAVGMNQRM